MFPVYGGCLHALFAAGGAGILLRLRAWGRSLRIWQTSGIPSDNPCVTRKENTFFGESSLKSFAGLRFRFPMSASASWPQPHATLLVMPPASS